MTTLEDFRRLATMTGQKRLIDYLDRLMAPTPEPQIRTPAEQLAACERAAGLATADTTSPDKETAR